MQAMDNFVPILANYLECMPLGADCGQRITIMGFCTSVPALVSGLPPLSAPAFFPLHDVRSASGAIAGISSPHHCVHWHGIGQTGSESI
jgi:hypothetical protein